MANTKSQPAKQQLKKEYILTVGRRREAVARIRLYAHITKSITWGEHTLKPGDIMVNERPVGKYFSGEASRKEYLFPLELAGLTKDSIITAKVAGGGLHGQMDAFIHGLARAIDKLDTDKYHKLLKEKDLLTRDARARQRRKVGMGGKSRRKKQSPKR